MKNIRKLIGLSMLLLTIFAPSANATIDNPDPTIWGNAISAESFNPTSSYFYAVEGVDFGSAFTATNFGFYFLNTDPTDPANRITLWGPSVHNANPSQSMLVDLPTATVYDMGNGFSPVASFSNTQSPIGFFYGFPGLNNVAIYSQSSLNQGESLFTFFPLLTDPSIFLVGIEFLNDLGNKDRVAYEIIGNLSAAVPVPASVWFMLTGILALRKLVSPQRT